MNAPSLENLSATVPQIAVDRKFMHDYRIASAVNGGGEITAVSNSSGQVELFTLGSDGTIWNFYPDPSSESGYQGVSTGMTGGAIAAGVDSKGRVVVFASNALEVNYIYETTGSIT